MLALVADAFRLSLSLAFMAGPCDLLNKATASSLLGGPVATVEPTDPEEDEDTGGMVSHCAYRGSGNAMLIVSQISFNDAATARKAITKESITAQLEGDVTELVEESGLGDKSWWAYNRRGAQYVVLKGARVVSLLLGGSTDQDSKAMRAQLRSAAATAAGALK